MTIIVKVEFCKFDPGKFFPGSKMPMTDLCGGDLSNPAEP